MALSAVARVAFRNVAQSDGKGAMGQRWDTLLTLVCSEVRGKQKEKKSM